jgi:hypothetical protein
MKGYDFIIEDRVPVIVYDTTIESIEERKKKAKNYDSIKKACQVLGVGQNAIRIAIRNRRRIFSPNLKKEVAVRYETSKK